MAGVTSPITSHSLVVRAMNRFSSHWLIWFVGQTTPVLGAGARPGPDQFVGQEQGVGVEALAQGGFAQRIGPCVPSHRAVARLDSWNSARGHSAVGSR